MSDPAWCLVSKFQLIPCLGRLLSKNSIVNSRSVLPICQLLNIVCESSAGASAAVAGFGNGAMLAKVVELALNSVETHFNNDAAQAALGLLARCASSSRNNCIECRVQKAAVSRYVPALLAGGEGSVSVNTVSVETKVKGLEVRNERCDVM